METKLLNELRKRIEMNQPINHTMGEAIFKQMLHYDKKYRQASRRADNWLKWSLIAIVVLLASSALNTISPYLSVFSLIVGIAGTPIFLVATGINYMIAGNYARKMQGLKKDLRHTLQPVSARQTPALGFPFGINTR
jgi:hypothetical protein